ncbi:hypothetical protein H4F99_09500 [Lysobacter sp. SG-8]|uniref:Uncharacterized protein n=1 Tax=Marilutibacter penaei TaxID=2759900 RepID=A0A7W3YEF2_9GAMM|nr:hypothetical protein [Lysobacter penaei]MBB1088724.1 hypothetical protein [Lysobacter penaei]
MNRLIATCLATALLSGAAACSATPGSNDDPTAGPDENAAPSRTRAPSADAFKAFIDEIRQVAGGARMTSPHGAESANPIPVADRIVAGFEQDPPRQLRLESGVTIYWGWQQGQAFVKSIAIRGTGGDLQLLGAIDDLPMLYSRRSGRAIADQTAYDAYAAERAERGSTPAVTLFARDDDALAVHLPLVQRWLQAGMLGFNADCNDPAQRPVCTFVETVRLPIDAYALECAGTGTGGDCEMPVPTVPPAPIPLGAFRQ